MRVAIRADASARMGVGHVMRCLTLANALAERGCEIRFVAALMSPPLTDRIRAAGHAFAQIAPSDSGLDREGWDRLPASEAEQRRDAERMRRALGRWEPDWIVLDHYRFSEPWERAARGGARLLAVDDLANRRHDCDLLLDQTFSRHVEDYRSLVPEGCAVLAGARYALLRPEFAAARPGALARRRTPADPASLLITLGGTDIGGLSANLLREALSTGIGGRIDLILGQGAPSREEAAALAASRPDVRLHIDSSEVARLSADADVAIGAAGSSSWERCCLGLPSVLLSIADNQRVIAENLSQASAAVAVGRWEEAVPAALCLLADPEARMRMTAASAAITDGTGAAAVAERLLGRTDTAVPSGALTIRPAAAPDSEALWLWRNDPLMRAMAKSHEPVPWPDHAAWFARALESESCLLLIGEVEGDPIGTVRFDAADGDAALVSINVAPAWRGRGLGAELLRQGCRVYDRRDGGGALEAEIQAGNRASERIFEANGFRPVGSGDTPGYALYRRAPPPPPPL